MWGDTYMRVHTSKDNLGTCARQLVVAPLNILILTATIPISESENYALHSYSQSFFGTPCKCVSKYVKENVVC